MSKKIMMVQDGCGYCAEAKNMLKDKIDSGEITVVDVYSEKGREIMQKHDIKSTPVILYEKPGGEMTKCMISKSGKSMFCDDGTQKPL